MTGFSAQDKSAFPGRRFGGNIPIVITDNKKNSPKFFKVKNPLAGRKLPQVPLFKTKRRIALTVSAAVIVIAGLGVGYYEYQLQQNPAVIYAHKLQTLTQAVQKHMSLPTNETPVIATVTDVTALPNEPFFKQAQDGDKILMYKKDKEAILYRPSTDQVITEAALDFQDVAPTPAEQAVAGASTSASLQATSAATQTANATVIGVTVMPAAPTAAYVPQGKVLIAPQH